MTDEGIADLFSFKRDNIIGLNNCSRTLRFMKMRSTGVRIGGVRILLRCAKNLQGVRCSIYDVLQALAAQLKNSDEALALKYLDFSNCFAILSKYLFLLPKLAEIRIGADAPPQMRQTVKRLLVDHSNLVSKQ